MCVSLWPSKFSQTITGTWEVLIDDEVHHVLWYQNRVGKGSKGPSPVFEVLVRQILEHTRRQEESPDPLPDWREVYAGVMQVNGISERDLLLEANLRLEKPGAKQWPVPPLKQENANALIIPLLGDWRTIRLLNTMENDNFLADISHAVRPLPKKAAPVPAGPLRFGAAATAVVFLQFSIYDIVLAENAIDVVDALQHVAPEKRPNINKDVFETLASWYGCPVAVCCFNNEETGDSKPLGFAFKPTYPDKLVVYTLDGHDGRPPDPRGYVMLDHAIFVGSYLNASRGGVIVNYSEKIPEHLRPYVLYNVMGMHVSAQMKNGDFIFDVESVRAGRFEGLRSLPPKGPEETATVPELLTRTEAYAID